MEEEIVRLWHCRDSLSGGHGESSSRTLPSKTPPAPSSLDLAETRTHLCAQVVNMIDFAQLVKAALAASILLLVIGLGMRATFTEATSFFRHMFQPPYSLLRAIV